MVGWNITENPDSNSTLLALRHGIISSAAISSIKSGSYKGNVNNQLDKLIAYFSTKAAEANVYRELEYVPTSISSKIYETIRACKIKGGFSIITGHAGIGKTKRGVCLNKDICAFAGLNAGDPVDVIAEDDGSVTIRKHLPKCRFCGDNVNAKSVMGIDVCPSCAERLAKEVGASAE